MDDAALEQLAASLSEAQRRDLTSNWDHFCEADYADTNSDDDEYPDQLEAAGFVYLDAVNDDDLETPFADELGIEPGGSVYRLTPLGLSVREILRSRTNGDDARACLPATSGDGG